MSTDKVSYDEFSKLDIRVGKIVEAKKVQGSAKLVELKIDLGGTVKRAVAGIASYYEVELGLAPVYNHGAGGGDTTEGADSV